MIKRKKRFVRDPSTTCQLTKRDVEILKMVYKNRFLSSDHIIALLGQNRKSILRRLCLMFHAGYLDRPRAQRVALENNSPMVYALGSRGADILASAHSDLSISKINWTEKNKNAKYMFLEHTLMVADILTVMELACRKIRGLDYIDSDEIIRRRLLPPSNPANPLSWKVAGTANKKFSFSIIPDGAFGLRISDEQTGRQSVNYYFLEADRATMPVFRHNLIRSSIYKKLIGYAASSRQRLFSKNFGFKKVFVITLTMSEERVKNMVKLNQDIHPKARGFRIFKFSDRRVIDFKRPEMMIGRAWTNGQGKTVSIVD